MNIPLAKADLGGDWLGWGSWSYENSSMECQGMRFIFEENGQELKRNQGQVHCSFLDLEEEALTIEKDGQNLKINGAIVGSYTDTVYQWIEYYNEKSKIKLTLERNAGHIDYTEEWLGKNDTSVYLIKGRLFKRGY